MTTLHRLTTELHALYERRTALTAGAPGRFYVQCGLEHRRSPERYDWHGAHRSGDPKSPFAVIQYTLAGAGRYETPDRAWTLAPGQCFVSIVPSEHRYYLPAGDWQFFFLLARHDYAITRLAAIVEQFGPVQHLAPDSAPVARMLSLFSDLVLSRFSDELALEQSLFASVLEYERHARSAFYPTHRTHLLEQVRRHVTANLRRPLNVADLAATFDMTRSHFSHYFRNTTGTTPAQFIADVRVQEVARRLTQTNQTIKAIAAETGFADANHLCKVFRRHFRTSPGQFRQRRSG